MNDKFNSGTLSDLVEYRLSRSRETLEEADYISRGEYFNAAVNRLYYACYYAAAALMISQKLEASSHKGIKAMLGLEFINKGKLDKKYGRIYQQLFENRQSGDYEDFVYCDKELFDILRPQAEDFVATISILIKQKG